MTERLRQRNSLHWLALAVALVSFGSIIAYNLWTMRQQLLSQEQQRLLTQARVIGKNLERQLEATSLALQGVVQDQPLLGNPANQERANKRLAVLADAIPGIRTIFFTDANGTILAANRAAMVGGNFRHRDYYRIPRQHPDPRVLYISPPFQSILNAYVFNISKVIPAKDGGFGGVVTAGIDPDYINDILNSALYAPDMWNTLNHGDGIRFMTAPQRAGQAGKNLAVPGSLFSRHIHSGRMENIYTDLSYATGEQRMAALLTVQPPKLAMDKSLVVIISRSPAVILQSWRNETLFQGSLFLLTCLASSLGLALLHRRQASLERAAHRAEAMVQVRYQLLEFATMHTVDELLQYALDEVCRLSESPVGFYHFVDPDQQALTLQAWSTRTLQEFCRAETHGRHYDVEQAGVWADCIRTRVPVIHNDYAGLPNKKGLPAGHAPVMRELVVPVNRDERIVAVLGVGNKAVDYTDKDAEEVLYLADVTWEIIDTRRAQQELKHANELLQTQARIDFLTGIYNRRMFDTLLAAEIARACRYRTSLSLIMLDLDFFKQVNDKHGHPVGDQVLQQFAELISGRIRSHDIFSRWGGEEFVVLTPCDEQQGSILAEILRELVEQYDFGKGLRITASLGVTSYRPAETAASFIERADQALYRAKHHGRNRVELLAESSHCATN